VKTIGISFGRGSTKAIPSDKLELKFQLYIGSAFEIIPYYFTISTNSLLSEGIGGQPAEWLSLITNGCRLWISYATKTID
jgi:hypothetical protein